MIGSFTASQFWGGVLGVGARDRHARHRRRHPRARWSSRCSSAACMNVLIEKVAYKPLRNAPEAGAADHGRRHVLHPPERRPAVDRRLAGLGRRPVHAQQHVTTILGIDVQRADLLAFVVTIPLVIAMITFITRTRLGKAMRATAQDPEAARLMGINVDTTISATFFIGGMMAGAAGLIYALYQTTIWYFQGFQGGLLAFTAAVMGGIGNLRGAVLGGLIIGCIQQISDNRPELGARVDARRRVPLPDPDHGLPAPGPVRRGNAGGRLMNALRTMRADLHARLPSLVGQGARGRPDRLRDPAAVHDELGRHADEQLRALAGLHRDGAGPEHGGRLRRPARPRLRGVLRARRLHVGLVQLGLLRRRQHPRRRRASTVSATCRGIHLNWLLVVVDRRAHLRVRRHHHRPADAAPARRLHRDRHPGLRRDRPRLRHQRRRDPPLRRELPADRRPPGHHPDRPARPPVPRTVQPARPADRGTGPRSCWC